MSAQAASFPTPTVLNPPDHFVGSTWVNQLVDPKNATDCTIGYVTFEPGARNSWHTHPAGQLLIVTAGTGYYQEKGQPAQLLRAGDAVSIGPGVEHWHGATKTSMFAHYAINPNVSQGVVDWGTPVTNEEYEAAHA